MADRIPCSNPQCRRTDAADKHPAGTTIVCCVCWKRVPANLKHRYKQMRARDRKLVRFFQRKKSLHITNERANALLDAQRRLQASNWDAIVAIFQTPEKPEGLDVFLEEAGLDDHR